MSARTPEQRAWLRRLRVAGWDGEARRFDPETALRILGRRDLDPRDILAMVHDTEELARLSAEANADAWGLPTVGVANVESVGWIVVVDLRDAIAALQQSSPDDGEPPPPR